MSTILIVISINNVTGIILSRGKHLVIIAITVNVAVIKHIHRIILIFLLGVTPFKEESTCTLRNTPI